MLNRDYAIEHSIVLFGWEIFDNLARVANTDCMRSEPFAREVFIIKPFATTAACTVERKNYARHYHNVDFAWFDWLF